MISYEMWTKWINKYNCLPYVATYDLENVRVSSWSGFFQDVKEAGFILESGKMGRYTFLGTEPVEIYTNSGNLPVIQQLRQRMALYKAPQLDGMPYFRGGIVGYLAYDIIRTIERLPTQAIADATLPDYWFMRVEKLWVIDQQEQQLHCVVYKTFRDLARRTALDLNEQYELARAESMQMKSDWDRWMQDSSPIDTSFPSSAETMEIDIEQISGLNLNFTKAQFIAAVHAIQQFIAQGDVFQVNLSVRQTKSTEATPEQIYEVLRWLNPSPYMAYMKLSHEQVVVCCSPELLIKLHHHQLLTRPIAGTRPRGANVEADVALEAELLLSEKERAEHIMLVDLERNDLGRIATYGSVQVKQLMAVEHYSHVMHIVSEVQADLAAGKDAFDTIAAVFPGGTITGAPKIRTMEIIEQLEPTRRGLYTGSIGWIDYDGNMELNIVIRTLLYDRGQVYVQSGAGIVIDSNPEKEFQECLNKAKALWKAVEISERKGVQE
jgi:para-aminobenzoate synthetase component 1